jgi:hypothetical protein
MATCRLMPMPSTRITKTRESTEMPSFDRVALTLLFLFSLTEVLNGAIRYYAAQYGFSWLPYLPHVLLFAALAPMFFAYVVTEGISSTYLTVLVLFGVAATFGVFNLGNASQVEFGFWTLVPFLYGIVVLPSIMRGWRRLVPYAVLLWALAVAGVLINLFHTWPWIGFGYQVGSTSIEASRLWRTNAVNFARLPGFSTGSYFAAVQILILALFLRETLRRKVGIPMWFLSGVAIVLTTSKTTIAIYLFLSIMHLFEHGPTRRSCRLIPFAAAAFDILLPFSMFLVRLDWVDSIRSPTMSLLVWSFAERLQVGWPQWILMIVERGNLVLGRGLGGIGTAQQYFEPALYSPADNIAVYLYGTFGVLGLIALLIYGWKVSRLRIDSPHGRFFFLCACVVLLDGSTTSVLEGAFTAMALGVSLRFLQGRAVRERRRVSSSRKKEIAQTSLGESPA